MDSLEIDQLVAVKIMGWGLWSPAFSNVGIFLTDNDLVIYQFSPSTKESDAFKVVERLKGKKHFILSDQVIEGEKSIYTAVFQYIENGFEKEVKSSDEKVAKAISLAALKAVGAIE